MNVMKKIIAGVTAFALALLAPQLVQAQGTMTYLSGLSTNSTGSVAVGSDSWLAADFYTGINSGGYTLDSIQLGMADASGSPSNFLVMLYTAFIGGYVIPGSNLDTLNGSLNPTTAGIFTYTPASTLTLSNHTDYFIVLTAGTTVAGGAYNLNESTYPPNSSGNWSVGNGIIQSSNGASPWSPTPYLGIAQFAITVTGVPEPSVLGLLGLGGLAFLWHHRKSKAVQ
jgi:hypothetical protein